MKTENQTDLQKLHQINLNQNTHESNDSRIEDRVTDIVRSDIDVAFAMQSLYIVLQSMLKL